ncbi:MAG: sulfite exporter TauE/SafE family protein [Candidatus Omnitrophica bacterium]|nr:sulfite exporter TauE/SafE family protein [Candidatus Omnitrophota bacterium]MBU1995999.1 sulfite exporter TauE/SafE family protein [Candidatus Omnitrophota bacterium]MBU4334672.1 sulfite exporter TauE/SafE family protein [Candidatus Omnitrophota bacterium]
MSLELLSALWLGVLTSMSPCTLTTNVAAVSFLSKKVNHPKDVLLSSMAYILGRMVTYAAIGSIIICSLVSVPSIAKFLQSHMDRIVGPILIIVGLFLLDGFKFRIPVLSFSHEKQDKLADSGVGGAFLLGVFFALSFCPIAAALYFGSLIPLALNSKIGVIYPFVYGIGTGIPVAIFAIGVVVGVKTRSKWFQKTAQLERWARRITGVIFVVVGLYFVWTNI